MLVNDVVHSMSLYDTLMVLNDDQTHVRDSFKTTFLYKYNRCLYIPPLASFKLVFCLFVFPLVCKCLGHGRSPNLSNFSF